MMGFVFKLIIRTVIPVAVVAVTYKMLIANQVLGVDWPNWGYAVPLVLIGIESIWEYKTYAKRNRRRWKRR